MQVGAVAAEEVRLFTAAALRLGADPTELMRPGGRPPSAGGRVGAAELERIVERSLRLTGQPTLGLRAATLSGAEVRLPDALHYAIEAAATVGDQLRLLARACRLVHADCELRIASTGTTARVTHRLWGASTGVRRQLSERALAGLALMVRRHTGSDFAVREISFAHPRPRDVSEHDQLLGAPLRWEQPCDALDLDAACLEAPVRGSDPALARVLGEHLETLLPPPSARDVCDRVRQAIREHMRGEPPALGAIAEALALAPRTLQRRLAARGTSYAQLVDEARRELAEQHLTASGLSIGEIAFLLGFSEVSAFHRAFRRWTGQTPAGFRSAGALGAHRQDSVAWGQPSLVAAS